MIVSSYLVRLEPFTQHFLHLQGGHFDLADRMFHSIEEVLIGQRGFLKAQPKVVRCRDGIQQMPSLGQDSLVWTPGPNLT